MKTLSELFASANGIVLRSGPHRCFYCGAPCDDTETTATWVKPTCNVWQYVAAPSSKFVCVGCAAALSESADVQVFGEPEKRVGQRNRLYSWVVTEHAATAYTKAHALELQANLLTPPDPPFGICLTTAGKKHLLYLGRVNDGGESVAVNLDEQIIRYVPSDLRERIVLVEHVSAAAGKPWLDRRESFALHRMMSERFSNGSELAAAWCRVQREPLSQLAAFVAANKETSGERYPATRVATEPAEARRAEVPRTVSRTLFDLG